MIVDLAYPSDEEDIDDEEFTLEGISIEAASKSYIEHPGPAGRRDIRRLWVQKVIFSRDLEALFPRTWMADTAIVAQQTELSSDR